MSQTAGNCGGFYFRVSGRKLPMAAAGKTRPPLVETQRPEAEKKEEEGEHRDSPAFFRRKLPKHELGKERKSSPSSSALLNHVVAESNIFRSTAQIEIRSPLHSWRTSPVLSFPRGDVLIGTKSCAPHLPAGRPWGRRNGSPPPMCGPDFPSTRASRRDATGDRNLMERRGEGGCDMYPP